MVKEKIYLNNIPVIVWGDKSDKAYIYVHGKLASKESAEDFAKIVNEKGYQTISFDLPEHGERTDHEYKCDIFNGILDLTQIKDYVFDNWKKVSLFACSLGAFFSLHAYKDKVFENCLFQSPIADMEYLINQMFLWFGVTEEQLKEKGEISTPVDILSWNYYQYVREHPIIYWNTPTSVLYAAKDDLQSREVIDDFCNRFNCKLTVSENSQHPFLDSNDILIVESWFNENI